MNTADAKFVFMFESLATGQLQWVVARSEKEATQLLYLKEHAVLGVDPNLELVERGYRRILLRDSRVLNENLEQDMALIEAYGGTK